jgi:hypothetical protein
MADATLTRISAHTWQGTLAGYTVQVFECPGDVGGPWFAAVLTPKPHEYTRVVLAAPTRAAAARARAWVGTNPLGDPA